MAEKYHATIRVGWNGFARDVQYDNGKTGTQQEKYDYRCRENNHGLKNLSQVDYNDILSGIIYAGNQTGGGTRPDKAFADAANMGWSSNAQKYLILITDGAPQGGGASSSGAALSLAQNAGSTLTNNSGVGIISIGLSTENVKGADDLFQSISASDAEGKMIYQAKDGDALKNSVVDALKILVSKAITVGTIKDTIDPAFYPVSTDGTPLKAGEKIDLNGKLTSDTTKPYGIIGRDGENWTVEWKEQDIIWPDENHPDGWHGRVLVKAKENFLGGNDISTNKKEASLDVKYAKVLNPNGTWSTMHFDQLMKLAPDQLKTRTMSTPYVNVDELEMTKNDTEWTVYLNTPVDPGTQMKALFNEIKVMKVVTAGEHEMSVQSGQSARDVMVYDLIPTDTGTYSYEEAASDERDKRGAEQADFNLKDLFTMTDSLGNKFIDSMTAEQAIDKLLAGEKVEVTYQGYGHSDVGKIILELKADPDAAVNNLNEHHASPEGKAVEKYILSAEYKPNEGTIGQDQSHTGSFGTKVKGKETEDKTKSNTHIVNVFAKGLKIIKVDMESGNPVGPAEFTLSSRGKDDTVRTTDENSEILFDPLEKPEAIAGGYEIYTLTETKAPDEYNPLPQSLTVNLNLRDHYTDLTNGAIEGPEDGKPYNWNETVNLTVSGVSPGFTELIVDPEEPDTRIVTYKIKNNAGVVLPSTGGTGAALFSIVGALTAGAALTVAALRKKERDE